MTLVLVADCESYRTGDFVAAATALRCRTIVASDGESPAAGDAYIEIDFADPAGAGAAIAVGAPEASAVLAVDDSGVVVAAEAAAILGLPHNPVAAAATTRDKLAMRLALAAADVAQPEFSWGAAHEVPALAAGLGFPVVIKPRRLSASRGVIRADSHAAAGHAAALAATIATNAGHGDSDGLLVEEYIAGPEHAVEGIMRHGELEVLAIIDKPVPLEGPYFAETLFVTPTRLADSTASEVVAVVSAGCRALKLLTGPIHAEVRIPSDGVPRLIEIAARTIGGLCGRALTFGLLGESLEGIVVRAALGLRTPDTSAALPASGVLMLPVDDGGVLDAVDGIDDVLALPGITGVEITAHRGTKVEALPAADRYLGFVFAAGEDADAVEATLRRAGGLLTIVIDGEAVGPLLPDKPLGGSGMFGP